MTFHITDVLVVLADVGGIWGVFVILLRFHDVSQKYCYVITM